MERRGEIEVQNRWREGEIDVQNRWRESRGVRGPEQVERGRDRHTEQVERRGEIEVQNRWREI